MASELAVLLQEGIIDEVLGGLKTGKEAEVCLVRHGGEVIAAKVYKARHARSFQHNASYKEGRMVRNTRTQRAMDRGSRFGQAAAEEAWKSAEADALFKLHAAGVRVPAPVLFYEGVLLMQLVVDAEGRPAPRLIDAPLTREQAGELYRDLRRQAITMLCGDLIHGDLSPYNVLLGEAGPTLIDFPQIISAAHNSRAEFFFRRDLENIRIHLAGLDPELTNSRGDASEIWRAFVRGELVPEFVPSGRPPADELPQSRRDRGRSGGRGEGRHGGGGQGGGSDGGQRSARQGGTPHGGHQGGGHQGGQRSGRPGGGGHGGGEGGQRSGRHSGGGAPHGGHGGGSHEGQRSGRQGGAPHGGQRGGGPARGGHGGQGPSGARNAGGPQGGNGRGGRQRNRASSGPQVSYVGQVRPAQPPTQKPAHRQADAEPRGEGHPDAPRGSR